MLVHASRPSRGRRALVALLGTLMLGVVSAVAPAAALADDATTTSVTGPATAPVHGQKATVTAHVADTPTPATVPTGKVQFALDGTDIGTPVTLAAGAASIDTPALSAGAHTITATYQPGAGFIGSAGTLNLTVAKADSTTAVSVAPNPTVAGEPAVYTAVVAAKPPGAGTPTGTVQFSIDGSGPIGPPRALSAGQATVSIEAGAGALPVRATYSGDAGFATSAATTTHTVGKADTFVVMVSTPNPSTSGQTVDISSYVDSRTPSNWWPNGTLSFTLDGAPVLQPFDVADGELVFLRATLATTGTRVIAAHFSGSADFNPSDGGIQQFVLAPPSVATPPPAAPTPPVGGTSVTAVKARGLTVKVTPKRDRRKPYRFTVSGQLLLPTGLTTKDGCRGNVAVEARMRGKRAANKTAKVAATCRWSATLTVGRKGSVSIRAAFKGNARVAAMTARAVTVRAG